jgi:GntR family transcriptional regulator
MDEKKISYVSPMHVQLREVIRNKIEDGEYEKGMTIPSENELAAAYGINRLTVRNAIAALVKEGLLKSVQGKGVYVMGPKIERDLETLGGFRQTMREKNKKPDIKLLKKVVRKAGVKYGYLFNIDPEDEIYYIKRICYSDDQPISLEEIFIPKNLFPRLEGMDITVFSLYEIYEFFGISVVRDWQTLSLTDLDVKDSKLLGLETGATAMLFEGTSYDSSNRVVEFNRNYVRGDMCNFTVHFKR